jgi:hypothetical protein
MFFRSFYGSSEPGTPPHHDSIPSNPLRPHVVAFSGYYASILALAAHRYTEGMPIPVICRTLLACAVLLCAAGAHAADMTRLNITVTTLSGTPIDRASVVVRFVEGRSIVKLGKSVRTTYELRTNQEGQVSVPSIPQGKIRIQVIAKGFQTFGQIYEVDQEAKAVDIKLNPPQQQYSSHQ